MALSTADIIVKHAPHFTPEEIDALLGVARAVAFAISSAQSLPITLDARARALVVTKLQEADHWCLELTRIAAK